MECVGRITACEQWSRAKVGLLPHLPTAIITEMARGKRGLASWTEVIGEVELGLRSSLEGKVVSCGAQKYQRDLRGCRAAILR